MNKSTMTMVLTGLLACALAAPAQARTPAARAATPPAGPDAPAGEAAAPAAAPAVATYAPPAASSGLSFSVARSLGSSAGLGLVPGGGSGPNPNIGGNLVPGLAARVGYRIDRLVAFGLLDLARFGASDDKGNCLESDPNYEDNCKTWESVSINVTTLTLGAGARYLLDNPATGLVTPYGTASLYASIPMLSSSSEATQKVLDKLAPGVGLGIELGGGAEYFLADAFSVGGEAGLRLATMSFADGRQGATALQFFTSVLLNFYL